MSVAFLETLATDLLEYEDLISPCIVCENGCLDGNALHIGSADLHLTLVVEKKDFVELHISTFCFREAVAEDFIASFYFKLLTCNIYDCVHCENFV